MNDREIKEILNDLGYGENPPDSLLRIVAEIRRRKCILRPVPTTLDDIVSATLFYDFCVKKMPKEKPNG